MMVQNEIFRRKIKERNMNMVVTRVSNLTGKTHTMELPITQAAIDLWKSGVLIQRAMPHLSAEQREFLISGVTQAEWVEAFGNDEDENMVGIGAP